MKDVQIGGDAPRLLLQRLDQIHERLSVLLGKAASVSRPAAAVHHLRLGGNTAELELFLKDIGQGAFGAHIIQQQRYSESLIAVNLRGDGVLDVTRLLDHARSLNLTAELRFMTLSE